MSAPKPNQGCGGKTLTDQDHQHIGNSSRDDFTPQSAYFYFQTPQITALGLLPRAFIASGGKLGLSVVLYISRCPDLNGVSKSK